MSSYDVVFLSLEDVKKAGGTNMKQVISDVENVLGYFNRGKTVLPDKTVLKWGKGIEDEFKYGRINYMPGYVGGDYNTAGIKIIGSNPDNTTNGLGLPRAAGIIVLSDGDKKFPYAIMDGTIVSAMRTGAVTGVAAKYLARKDSKVVGIIGAGLQSRTQIKAVLEVCKNIETIYVNDLYFDKAEEFAKEIREKENVNAIAVKDAKDAVINSDILITVTMTTTPIIKKDWLKKGAFYSHIGGYECEFDVILDADMRVVDNWEGVKHRGVTTIGVMQQEGIIGDDSIYAELGEIVNGNKEGRTSEDQVIFFAAVGMGTEDIAVAHSIYQNAVEKHIGQKITLWNDPNWL